MGTENKNMSVVNDHKKPRTKNKAVKTEQRVQKNRAVIHKDEP